MKKIVALICLNLSLLSIAQDHYSGISTSKRTGILNGTFNPAELASLNSKVEIHLFSLSTNVANNKLGFNDLTSDTDLEEILFTGSEPVNLRLDVEIFGPSLAFKYKKWGFGVSSKAFGKLNLVDIDVNIGDAISNSGINSIFNSTVLIGNNNQRLNGTTYGELGLSVARNIWENEKYNFNAGATVKLLFPGSYANFGANQLNGTVTTVAGNSFLTNTNATLNIAYSGSLANSFSDFEDYRNSVFGNLNGLGLDIGAQFTLKDSDKSKGYKINSGISVRNIGSMKFTDANNSSTDYSLVIQGNESLNLSQFDDVESLQEIEQILLDSGFLTAVSSNRDFKVKLPTVINIYSDFRLVPSFYLSVFWQQKINDDNQNDQITAQNTLTLTPRFSLKHFEVFSPWTQNEISGLNGGIGFRAGGFFVGSGSVITSLINDSKHADFYLGFRLGIGKS